MAGGKQKRKKKKKLYDRFVKSYDKLISDDPEELIHAIVEYQYDCHDYMRVYTATGMAMALGLQRQTFLDFGVDDHENPDVVAVIHTAKLMVEAQLEERLQGRAATGAAFNLKANFGWQDLTKVALGGGKDGDDPLVPERTIDPSKLSTELLKELRGHLDSSTAKPDKANS